MIPTVEYGPPFPPSAQNLIMTYHRAHSNSLRLAHYIGPYAETFVPVLADYFQHIHISCEDTSRVRENLGEFYAANWWKAKFSFSDLMPEESRASVVKGSVDMSFLVAPEDWEDVDGVVDDVAESLAPNGTMCVLGWNKVPQMQDADNSKITDAVDEILYKFADVFSEQCTEEKLGMYASALDFIPLRHEEGDKIWIQDVTKRIKINRGDEEWNAFEIREGVLAESKVGAKQRTYAFGEYHEEAKGWMSRVDKTWFRGWIRGWERQQKMSLLGDRELAHKLEEVEKVVGDEKVELKWAASILLATRK